MVDAYNISDYLADTSKVPYILDEFSYFFETPFSVTNFDTCALDRPSGSNGDGLMMLLNHSKNLDLFGILIPDVGSTGETNAATGEDSIGEHAELCKSTWGREPNVVLVDNFNIGRLSNSFFHSYVNKLGDVFTAQNNLNHL